VCAKPRARVRLVLYTARMSDPLARRPAARAFAAALLPRLALATASIVLVVLALCGLELAARRWSPDYLVQARGLHVFSRTYGWAGRPGAVASMGGGRVTLNARGYRGRELPSARNDGRTRVVVLGDSIAFGYGVADEETFPWQLDVRDNGIAAANLGVQGYGPGQELLVLMREGLRQRPDVVVLAFCLRNDFVDAVLPVALYDGTTPRPRFRLSGERLVLDGSPLRLSPPRRLARWLSDESHLFNRLSALAGRHQDEPEHDWRYRKQQALHDEQAAFQLTLALVLEMHRVCRRHGIAFLVATFPNGLGYETRTDLATRLHRQLESRGVPVVDMGARFQELGLRPAELALDRTGHLGPRGHAVSCQVIEREIRSRFVASRAASSPAAAAR
jgi:hypothetical protein